MELTRSTDQAVSWAAVFAGALATASVSLILIVLAGGLGVSINSPWVAAGSSVAVSAGLIFWLIFSQMVAGGIGGYLAGRLRVRWRAVHSDEVYFRDTAHGFLAWSLATVGVVLFVFSGTLVAPGLGVDAPVKAALWSFAALLAGAFSASLMGIYGGRQRDADVSDLNVTTTPLSKERI